MRRSAVSFFTVIVVARESNAINDHRNDSRDERHIGSTSARRVDGHNGPEPQIATRAIVQCQESPIAFRRRYGRVAVIKGDFGRGVW